MKPIDPAVMIRQVESLSADLHEQTGELESQLDALDTKIPWNSIQRVLMIGAGDSQHAAWAARMAYERFADVDCEIVSGQHVLDYGLRALSPSSRGHSLVVCTSFSGGTRDVVLAAELAAELGIPTIAITGNANSSLLRTAGSALVFEPRGLERSPGIRSYQSSLVSMLLLAIHMGKARTRIDRPQAAALRKELELIRHSIDATNQILGEHCPKLAQQTHASSHVLVVGSGPSYGTARFCAAKMVEASGQLAIGQDLEGWFHVERFALPAEMPVIVIAPPGRSNDRATHLASAAQELGRRVIAVAQEGEVKINSHAWARLPVRGSSREEFSPLLYHLFSSHLASRVAECLGRSPFQTNPRDFVKGLDDSAVSDSVRK